MPVTENTPLSGIWIDGDRAAQGLNIEQLDPPVGAPDDGPPRVSVTWFTWAPAADANPGPRWMFGIGTRSGDTVVVESMQMAVSGSFPADPALPAASFADWGRIEIQFLEQAPGGEGVATLSYEGPAGWGAGARQIKQITAANTGLPYDLAREPAPEDEAFYSSGTYSDPLSFGQGWILTHYRRDEPSPFSPGGKRIEATLLWFSYDQNQKPTWYIGIDPDLFDGVPQFPVLRATTGGTFEGGEPVLTPWGKAYLTGSGGPPLGINCGQVKRFAWEADLIGTPPPLVYRSVGRITRTFDPYVPTPQICFS